MFTKEKWAVNSANKQEVNSYNGIAIADCSKSVVIEVREKEANARLIAAAPTLLEALKSLQLSVMAHPDFSGEENEEWTDLVNFAQEAIVLAEG